MLEMSPQQEFIARPVHLANPLTTPFLQPSSSLTQHQKDVTHLLTQGHRRGDQIAGTRERRPQSVQFLFSILRKRAHEAPSMNSASLIHQGVEFQLDSALSGTPHKRPVLNLRGKDYTAPCALGAIRPAWAPSRAPNVKQTEHRSSPYDMSDPMPDYKNVYTD